ncbi:MAG: PDZ domain-containing protein [Parachlamydiales bacterium]|nr:PDZ domain-containing protein [Parachlamydiales bacterium]
MSLIKKCTQLICVALISCATLLSAKESVQYNDVPKIVNHILSYHIEHKKITPLLIGRSFKVFTEQVDPAKEYFLAGELTPFFQPNNDLIQLARLAFTSGDMSAYVQLNQLTQSSILRQRQWRQEFRNNTALLNLENDNYETNRYTTYALSESELKERVRQQLVRFVNWHQKDAKFTNTQIERTLDLFERQVTGHENAYLYVNGSGKSMSQQERESGLSTKVVKSLTAALDSHSNYYTTNEAYHLKVQLEKELCGIGVVFQEGIDGVRISRLVNGGPAEQSGLILENDLLVEVDGKSINDMPFEQALNLLRGDEHSTVGLGLVRRGEAVQETKLNVQLKRAKIVMQEDRLDVSYDKVEGGIIAKLTLYGFYEGDYSSEKDLKNALEKLYKIGDIKGLVLDLRYNTGGFLTQAIKVAGLFITNGVVAMAKYSDGTIHYFRDLDGYVYFEGPMVILTSRGSASAAEIVAQSLQDYGVAIVVGDDRTYGKGTIQYQNVTDDRAQAFFKVTVGRYYSVSGKSIQLEGVKADIVVPTAFYDMDIGEKYTEYPLTPDHLTSAFDDPLSDIDPMSYPWFKQYYVPTVQKRLQHWREMVSELKQSSKMRTASNKEYQAFLQANDKEGRKMSKKISRDEKAVETDFVMEEATSIVREMIQIRQIQVTTAK